MSDLIQWPRAKYWDKPWNPFIGCQPISPACDNCYAKAMTARFSPSDAYAFKPHATSHFGPPTKGVVFCGNMTDLFGSWVGASESLNYLSRLWSWKGGYKKLVPHDATYLFLTKRPDRMCDVLCNHCRVPHAYFGFTGENQEWYDRRFQIWYERFQPARFYSWVSLEPLLGPIDLHLDQFLFDWVVVGCESGPNRRSCRMQWVESVVCQAVDHKISVFVKQLDIDGECVRDIERFPQHLRIRQVPWRVK